MTAAENATRTPEHGTEFGERRKAGGDEFPAIRYVRGRDLLSPTKRLVSPGPGYLVGLMDRGVQVFHA